MTLINQAYLPLICIFLATIFSTKYNALAEDESWSEYKSRYNKSYSSQSEEELRMKIFLDNKQYIDSYNTKSQVSFTQSINPLSDLTPEEVIATRCGFRLNLSTSQGETKRESINGLLEALLVAVNQTAASANQSDAISRNGWFEDFFSPSKLDWRSSGRVSRVKDQGSCGSCWAFATTGALEGILASRKKYILLSEQNLVDCSRQYGNHGCSGGLMNLALKYVRDEGIMASKDYPYTGKNNACKFRPNLSVMSVRGSALLPSGNEALLRLALALAGPLPVAIDASPRSFHSYKSGVYDDPACRNSENSLNHAVLLVGYGTDKKGGDYWILKNSWGIKWGNNGYIKVARNKRNHCGVASFAVLPIE